MSDEIQADGYVASAGDEAYTESPSEARPDAELITALNKLTKATRVLRSAVAGYFYFKGGGVGRQLKVLEHTSQLGGEAVPVVTDLAKLAAIPDAAKMKLLEYVQTPLAYYHLNEAC